MTGINLLEEDIDARTLSRTLFGIAKNNFEIFIQNNHGIHLTNNFVHNYHELSNFTEKNYEDIKKWILKNIFFVKTIFLITLKVVIFLHSI